MQYTKVAFRAHSQSILQLLLRLLGLLSRSLPFTLYADDLCLWASGVYFESFQGKLQKRLYVADLYLKERGMKLSSIKSVVLPLTLKREGGFRLSDEENHLQFEFPYKFMGIILYRTLIGTATSVYRKKAATA